MSRLWRELFWPVLFPIAGMWAGIVGLRRRFLAPRAPHRVQGKVVVVGNIHSGGSGKTPLLAAIAERFHALGPVIVSRGYRGALSKAGSRVQDHASGPALYGDEAWMLHRRTGCPVYIGAHRGKALERAQAETGSRLFLLDDGFQNFSFRHGIDLVAVSMDRPVAEYCLPLGDLREGLGALASATAVLLSGEATSTYREEWKSFVAKHFPELTVFEVLRETEGVWGREGRVEVAGNLGWGAFCGIANPGRFGRSLQQVLRPDFLETFADHHAYSERDIDELAALQKRRETHHLITTEKDWHKASPLFEARNQALFYLRIRYVFPESFWYFLETRLETA
ncbi:tetraacyldisaccharide 4'-kinase [bacterium]|nr:tetraacyldisaccharide 4'-kinase [bacterium]